MLTTSILVAEPDTTAKYQVMDELRRVGHRVHDVPDAYDAIAALDRHPADLLLLDGADDPARMLSILRRIKDQAQYAAVRVLMTSSRQPDRIAVEALRSGADDFLAKPYAMAELMARVTLCLKRQPVRGIDSMTTQVGKICIDDSSHRVTVNNQLIELAPREYHLLHFFASNVDRLYSRQQLLTFVWQQASGLGERTVDVHVRRLRRLLEPFGCEYYVETVRGVGYRFSPDTPAAPAKTGLAAQRLAPDRV